MGGLTFSSLRSGRRVSPFTLDKGCSETGYRSSITAGERSLLLMPGTREIASCFCLLRWLHPRNKLQERAPCVRAGRPGAVSRWKCVAPSRTRTTHYGVRDGASATPSKASPRASSRLVQSSPRNELVPAHRCGRMWGWVITTDSKWSPRPEVPNLQAGLVPPVRSVITLDITLKPSPATLVLGKSCLPPNQSLMPKRLGTAAQGRESSSPTAVSLTADASSLS